MNVTHHPSDVALAAFAFGTLDEGRSLVLATHLPFCPACRAAVRTFEHVGGAILDRSEPAALRTDALDDRFHESCRNEGIHLVFLTPI
jgi:putative transcriptional regulator